MRTGYFGKERSMKAGRSGGHLRDWNSEVKGCLSHVRVSQYRERWEVP